MKTGRLSYSTGTKGERLIDTAELDRVFGIKTVAPHDGFNGAISASEARIGNGVGHAHAAKSHVTHEPESDQAGLVIAAQAETIARQDATIADLRARLDVEAAERRQLSERLHGVLTPPDRKQEGALPLPPDDLKPSRLVTVSDPPAAVLQDGADPQKDAPSARAGLAIPRPPWWRRWVR